MALAATCASWSSDLMTVACPRQVLVPMGLAAMTLRDLWLLCRGGGSTSRRLLIAEAAAFGAAGSVGLASATSGRQHGGFVWVGASIGVTIHAVRLRQYLRLKPEA